jgi:hypothetical protein
MFFPSKLHKLLEEAEEDSELSRNISWLPNGMCFKLHSPESFEKKVMKKYFPRSSRVTSFLRQLQYYGFGNHGNMLFSHPSFIRDRYDLCANIRHQISRKCHKDKGKSTRPLRSCGRRKKSTSAPEISTLPPPPLLAKETSNVPLRGEQTMPGNDINSMRASSLARKLQAQKGTKSDGAFPLANNRHPAFLTCQFMPPELYLREEPLPTSSMMMDRPAGLAKILYQRSLQLELQNEIASHQLMHNFWASRLYSVGHLI